MKDKRDLEKKNPGQGDLDIDEQDIDSDDELQQSELDNPQQTREPEEE